MRDRLLEPFLAYLRLGVAPATALVQAAGWQASDALSAAVAAASADVSAGTALSAAIAKQPGLFSAEARFLMRAAELSSGASLSAFIARHPIELRAEVAERLRVTEDDAEDGAPRYAAALAPYASNLPRLRALDRLDSELERLHIECEPVSTLLLEIRFANLLSQVLRQGVPMLDVLAVCIESVRDPEGRRRMHDLREYVGLGGQLSDALGASGMFEPRFVEVVRAGEGSPLGIPGALLGFVDLLEADLRRALAEWVDVFGTALR